MGAASWMLMWANVDVSPGVSRSDQGSLHRLARQEAQKLCGGRGLHGNQPAGGRRVYSTGCSRFPSNWRPGIFRWEFTLIPAAFAMFASPGSGCSDVLWLITAVSEWCLFCSAFDVKAVAKMETFERSLKKKLLQICNSGQVHRNWRTQTGQTLRNKRLINSGEKSCKKCLSVTSVT